MTSVNRSTLYSYFLTSFKPTQQQFANLIDSNLNLATTSAQQITSNVSSLGSLDIHGNFSVSGNATFNGPINAISSAALLVAITDDTATNATMYPTFVAATSANQGEKTSGTKLTYNPSTGAFSSPIMNASTQLQVAGSQVATPNLSDVTGKTSWTPVLNFGGSTTGITYSTQTGTYTKIGKMIVAEFSMALSNKGSQTGSATITGLPVSANSTGACIISFAGNVSGATSGLNGYVGSDTTINLVTFINGGSLPLTNGNFFNSSAINATCIYITV